MFTVVKECCGLFNCSHPQEENDADIAPYSSALVSLGRSLSDGGTCFGWGKWSETRGSPKMRLLWLTFLLFLCPVDAYGTSRCLLTGSQRCEQASKEIHSLRFNLESNRYILDSVLDFRLRLLFHTKSKTLDCKI